MKLFIAQSAYKDLSAIKGYYTEKGVPHIGLRFVNEIVAHIQTLPDHPEIGRIVPEFESPKLRELIHVPFRIVYLREQEAIRVVRVWRSERLLLLPDSE